MKEEITADAFSVYPHRMTRQEAESIEDEVNRINTNALVFLETKHDTALGNYQVRVAYNGGRKVWQEPGGRQHRLSGGILTITSAREWDDIYNIITKGISAEF